MRNPEKTSRGLALLVLLLLPVALLVAAPASADHHDEKAAEKPEEMSDAISEEAAKGQAILEAADAATRKVEAVSFEGALVPTGIALNFVQPTRGHGLMAGWDEAVGIPKRFYGVAHTTRDGAEVKIEGGGNGETYYLIDHATKKGYEDIDPGVMGTIGNALRGIGIVEMVHPTPFADELESEVKYLGTDEVEGLLCDKVEVVYTGGRGKSTWFIAQEDHLPRRRVRHFETPNGNGTVEITMSALKVDPEIDPATFTMTLPEGYERVDDFAP